MLSREFRRELNKEYKCFITAFIHRNILILKVLRNANESGSRYRVALEALKGIKTIQQIAKDFDVHPVQVSDWKKAMTEGATGIFGPGREKADAEDFER